MPPEPDWSRLAEYVIARRVALGYQHRRSFADAVGVSDRTLAKVEDGTSVGRSTLGALDNALRWTPGSAAAVLRGSKPTPISAGRADPPVARLGELLPTRRIELNPGYAARAAFAAAVGLDEAFVENVEHGRIPILDEGQQTAIERAYRWAPGSVVTVLSGGDPTPADIRDVSGSAYMAATSGAEVSSTAGEIVVLDLRTAPGDASDRVKELWNNYPVDMRIICHLPIPEWQRAYLLDQLTAVREALRKAQAEKRGNGDSQAS